MKKLFIPIVLSLFLAGCGGMSTLDEPPSLPVPLEETPIPSILDDLKPSAGTEEKVSSTTTFEMTTNGKTTKIMEQTNDNIDQPSILDDLKKPEVVLPLPATAISQPLNYSETVPVIFYQTYRIPADQLFLADAGEECGEKHWHAKDPKGVFGFTMELPHTKTFLPEPHGCGYGTEKQRPVFEVDESDVTDTNRSDPKLGF